MKFKKNIIPLGSGEVLSARTVGGEAQFYLAGEGVIIRKTYNLSAHTLKTDSQPAAYADAYLALQNGAVQDLGEVVYNVFK